MHNNTFSKLYLMDGLLFSSSTNLEIAISNLNILDYNYYEINDEI